ncbi:MAG TPA: DIP1984 family protein [Fimbriimonadaceae bacterium]|nr:DIP1984 family protein [Fimbriimonadaceae bacterium]
MKLAEALVDRAACQKAIEQLQQRLNNIALVQEGDQPVESPQDLLTQLDGAYARLTKLVAAINRTNAATSADGETLTSLLARRDSVKKQLAFFNDFATAAVPKKERHGMQQVRFRPSISVPEMRQRADSVAADLRRLELRIQALNWQIDLIE